MEAIRRRNDIIADVEQSLSRLSKNAPIKGADGGVQIPSRKEIARIIQALQQCLFPSYFDLDSSKGREALLYDIYGTLKQQISLAKALSDEGSTMDADSLCSAFIAALPEIYALLLKDVEAIYTGDPAAKSYEEVLISYPGFFAITIYRFAHALYRLGVPIIPRMMTEFAHEKTGIDIHAGAQIGEYFFIDHGTGIIIGETAVIGDHVKLYQGVTLGAKSFPLDENGNPVKNIKRHPQIGNRVIIYANATILGGDTFVSDDCVIGGNVWLTRSTVPGETVYYTKN